MKGVFVIIDGVADEPCSSLNGRTPLEFAKTPYLDELAKKSRIDYCYPIKEGIAPESSSAVVSLLGYDYRESPRGPLEAQGAGIKLAKGDLALRCNFATIDKIDGEILDSRAGRTLTTKEAHILAKEINEKVKLPYKFEFHALNQHRAVLIFRGGFSDNISNADPFYGDGVVLGLNRKMIFSKALDDEEDSKLSANLVNSFVRHSYEILNKHGINIERVRKGLYPANIILCRDAGNSPIKFKKLRGKWMALGYMPLEIGIAKAVGMEAYKFKYPKLKGIDIYSTLYLGLRKAIKYAVKMMKRNYEKYDYFYIHFKETDIPGHDGRPRDKVKMIEIIDNNFFSFLNKYMDKTKIVITADHTTSCNKKRHTSGAVPVLIYLGKKGKEGQRFTEKNGLKGKKWSGKKLLEGTLF